MKKILVTLNFDEKYYDLIRDMFDHYYVLSKKALLKNFVCQEQHTFTGIDCGTDGKIIYLVREKDRYRIEDKIKDLMDLGIIDSSIIERA